MLKKIKSLLSSRKTASHLAFEEVKDWEIVVWAVVFVTGEGEQDYIQYYLSEPDHLQMLKARKGNKDHPFPRRPVAIRQTVGWLFENKSLLEK